MEDPKVRRHLEVIRRKEMLERVLAKMESLKVLEGMERRGDALRSAGEGRQGAGKERRTGWALFNKG
ncbi:MAG: hypothetical protein Q9184_008495, partial [Pyrenodesmia sp. 2 TL-2023]